MLHGSFIYVYTYVSGSGKYSVACFPGKEVTPSLSQIPGAIYPTSDRTTAFAKHSSTLLSTVTRSRKLSEEGHTRKGYQKTSGYSVKPDQGRIASPRDGIENSTENVTAHVINNQTDPGQYEDVKHQYRSLYND